MMKKLQFKRIFSLAVMTLLIMGGGINSTLNAQKSDGFFRGGIDDSYINRDTDGINLGMTLDNPTTEDPTAEAPLGSGLLIMTVAAAGYALARRNKAVRKGATMILALGLVLGMTQCRKNTVAPVSPASNGFNITVNANYGGDKTTFDPSGTFSWNGTEYINVSGKKSGYLGVLSGTDGTFTGTLSDPAADEEELYFFYLGNGNHENATTLDFSNQDGSIGNVTDYHIAIGKATYEGEQTYNTTLAMAMAIARFDLSGFTNSSDEPETVYIHGDDVYATATIDYNNGAIAGGTKGYIKAGTASNSIYVALIPSVSSETTVKFDSNSKTGSMTFHNGIQASKYYCGSEHAALAVTSEAGSGIPGTFSVSATKKVFFSKGNLQYQASTGTWRFAGAQYYAIGNNAGNNVFDGTRSTQAGWIDLFGWGTSGWNNGNTNYMPYNNYYTSPEGSSTGYGYGPKVKSGSSYIYTYDLTGDYANADWGVFNIIENGGTGWRTLTGGTTSDAEWHYLLFTRTASTIGETENARFAKGNVNSIHGVIVFPDSYTHPSGVAAPTGINKTNSDAWNSNNYDLDDWSEMEASGAVFLPVTGRTENATVYVGYSPVGYYWSASNNGTNKAYGFYFGSGTLECSSYYRYYGYAVRLVKDVE